MIPFEAAAATANISWHLLLLFLGECLLESILRLYFLSEREAQPFIEAFRSYFLPSNVSISS